MASIIKKSASRRPLTTLRSSCRVIWFSKGWSHFRPFFSSTWGKPRDHVIVYSGRATSNVFLSLSRDCCHCCCDHTEHDTSRASFESAALANSTKRGGRSDDLIYKRHAQVTNCTQVLCQRSGGTCVQSVRPRVLY